MKPIRLFVLTFFCLEISCVAFGQKPEVKFGGNDYYEFIKKTTQKPKSFSFTDYSKKGSVDIATGRFGLNVPFYIMSNEYIELPVGLMYCTSGVKVNQLSTEVGIDWSLMGKGSITRELKGAPDDLNTNSVNTYNGRCSYFWPEFHHFAINSGEPRNFCNKQYGGYAVVWKNKDLLNVFPVTELGLYTSTNLIAEALPNIARAPVPLDLEPDIFKVSAGNLSFSFMLINEATSFSESKFRAVPLDDTNIKIDVVRKSVPFFWDWVYSYPGDPAATRRRTVNANVITEFQITDKNGVRYIFSHYELTEAEYLREIYNNSSASKDFKRTFQYVLEESYISSWSLSQINFPNGESVVYNYIDNNMTISERMPRKHTGEYKGFNCNIQPEIPSGGKGVPYLPWSNLDILYTRIYGHQLKSIDFTGHGSVEFNYSNNRPDLSNCGWNLSSLILKNPTGTQVRKFDLIKEFTDAAHLESYNDYRMFLKQIIDSREESSMSFSYYHHDALPTRERIERADLYGYFGGYTGLRYPHFPKLYIDNSASSSGRIFYERPKGINYVEFDGYDRSVNPETVKYGVMSVVDFPSGGKLEIEFEPNTFSDPKLEAAISYGPGVRVKKLKYYSRNNQPELIKKYFYNDFENPGLSSGHLLYKPSYAYLTNYGFDNEKNREANQTKTFSDDNPAAAYAMIGFYQFGALVADYIVTDELLRKKGYSVNDRLKKLTEVSSHPLGPLSDGKGREIIYSNVRESIFNEKESVSSGHTDYYIHYQENDKTEVNVASGPTDEFTYIPPAQKHVEMHFGCYAWNETKVMYGWVEKQGTDIYPFPSRNEFENLTGMLNGTITAKYTYEADDSIPIQKEIYSYSRQESDQSVSVKNLVQGYLPTHNYKKNDANKSLVDLTAYHPGYKDQLGLYFFSRQRYVTEAKLILSSKLITRNLGGKSISEIESYDYYHDGRVERITNTNSNDEVHSTSYTYPDSYVCSLQSKNIYQQMVDSNMLVYPIEKVQKKNNKIINAEIKSYRNFESIIKPNAFFKLNSSEPLTDYVPMSTIQTCGTILDYRMKKEVELTKYDTKNGTLLEFFNPIANAYSCYYWGYSKAYPVAQFENMRYSNIEDNAALTLFLNQLDDYTQITAQNREQLNSLNKKIREEVSTLVNVRTYTYDPLVGITSETDPNGVTTYYEYDSFGRLESVKDNDRHVLEQYDYHYAGGASTTPPSLSVSTSSADFLTGGGTSTINVVSNVSWSVTESSPWLSVGSASGSNNGSFTITCSSNTGSARSTQAIVSGGGITKTIQVNQIGVPFTFNLTTQNNDFRIPPDFNPLLNPAEEANTDLYFRFFSNNYSGQNLNVSVSASTDPDPVSVQIEYDGAANGWINVWYNATTNTIAFSALDPMISGIAYAVVHVTSNGLTRHFSVVFESFNGNPY